MTSERGSFDDPGVDAIIATREDELTGTGLDDAAPTTGAGFDTGTSSYGSTSGSSYAGSSSGSSSGGSGDRLQDAAGGVVDRVAGTAQDKVGTQVNSQLSRAGDVLEQLAGAVRQSGDQLRDQQPQIAGFADTAAQQVDKASRYLRQTDMQGLVREAEDFARRQPAVFLGGALALGLIASRFLKASPQGGSRGRSFGGYQGYNAGYSGGYGSGYGYGGGYGSGYGAAATSYGQSTYGSTGTGGYGGGTGYAGQGGTGSAGTTGAEHGGV